MPILANVIFASDAVALPKGTLRRFAGDAAGALLRLDDHPVLEFRLFRNAGRRDWMNSARATEARAN